MQLLIWTLNVLNWMMQNEFERWNKIIAQYIFLLLNWMNVLRIGAFIANLNDTTLDLSGMNTNSNAQKWIWTTKRLCMTQILEIEWTQLRSRNLTGQLTNMTSKTYNNNKHFKNVSEHLIISLFFFHGLESNIHEAIMVEWLSLIMALQRSLWLSLIQGRI